MRLLSVGATIGFVTLFGITLRNSIMIIFHYEHLVKFEEQQWNLGAAIPRRQRAIDSYVHDSVT
jgi:multidrug efflux pump subunit AcrB